jgi:hypothetical protein
MNKRDIAPPKASLPRRILGWLDAHGLFSWTILLLVVVPLYPKLPLFDLIEGYIVRARIEDILILIAGVWWVIAWRRGKVSLQTPLTTAIVGYAVVGALSLFSAIYIIGTIPIELIHIGKSTLHYFRYLEYFFLFFLAFTTITTRKKLWIALIAIVLTLVAVVAYGYGQKYWYWPVYSTMNREFSKGMRLYLTEHARVQSTFGGHYDMAAYLVLITTFTYGLFSSIKQGWRWGLFVVYLLGIWLLVMSGSRSSFAGYGASMLILWCLILFEQWGRGWKKALPTAFKHGALIGISTTVIMLSFGQEMYDRFMQTLQGRPVLYGYYNQINEARKTLVHDTIPTALGLKDNPQIAQINDFLTQSEPPAGAVSTDELEAGLVASDTRPTPVRPTTPPSDPDPQTPGDSPKEPTDSERPSDVYLDIPDLVRVATVSADGTITYIYVEKERTFSQTSIDKGLSEGIRLDALWPQAVRGFFAQPWLGSGYATLNKESAIHFTEAESTDNNFLRSLGETGVLGFLTFYGAIGVAIRLAWVTVARLAQQKTLMHHEHILLGLNMSLIAASFGLLLNAYYIDVFAASKVAMSYWLLVGIVLAARKVLSKHA